MKLTTILTIGLISINIAVMGQHPKVLKIVNLRSKPIVQGMLNGKVAYFLLDTGSDLTILHAKSARRYGFRLIQGRSRPLMIEGLGGSYRDFKRATELKLFMDKSLIYTHFFAYDLSNIVNSIHANTNVRIAGIIGSDVMRKYGFKIDYGNRLVSFTSVEYKKKQNKQEDEPTLSVNK